MMDAIIEPRRIEEFAGFSVVERIDGVDFVRARPAATNKSGSEGGGVVEEEKEKRGRILFLPGLDGSGCTLGPQVRW